MSVLPLHALLASKGASFGQRHGAEVVTHFSDLKTEYQHVRDAVGLTDFSFMRCFRVPESGGLDFLDGLVAGNVAKVRFGRVLHTFLADDGGSLVADCYIANNDDEFVMLCESLADDAALAKVFESHGAAAAGVESLSGNHVALSIDGFKAWAVVKELFGADVLGLPYLSIETYPFGDSKVRLLRAGKTSEFGYLLLAPVQCAAALFDRLGALVAAQGGGLCGVSVHNELRLEGRFFNIFAEGASVRDPLMLGLQWMIDFDKDAFVGRDVILKRRQAGLTKKIIGIATGKGNPVLKAGDTVYDGGAKVADVVASCYSYVLDSNVGLALFPNNMAYAGLSFNLNAANGPAVRTVSMPPIMPRSLGVKLDEM